MVALIRHRPARNIMPPLNLLAGVKAVADQPGVKAVPDKPFLTDIKTLRERARQHIENGAVTEGYRADRNTVVKLLNEALATEIVCVLRYKRHYFMASGIHAEGVAAEFLQHANEEQGHADLIAQRIVQLGGEPNFNPDGLLTRSHAEYVEGQNLLDMIKEDLVAERIAIDSYREMINYVGNDDSTTRRMLEGILAMEEEHAEDLVSLLAEIGG
jgi:bacterioferritin